MDLKKIFIYVLGSAQDGGYPHFGCKEECCQSVWEDISKQRSPSCLALVDMNVEKYWLFDITPEVKNQIHILDQFNYSMPDEPYDNVDMKPGLYWEFPYQLDNIILLWMVTVVKKDNMKSM